MTKLSTALRNLSGHFTNASAASAESAKMGAILREDTRAVLAAASKRDDALEAIRNMVAKHGEDFLTAHPRPDAKTDTPEYKVWAAAFKTSIHNPLRAINVELASQAEAGKLSKESARISLSMAGKATIVALPTGGSADPVKSAITAISKLPKNQGAADAVIAAMVAHFKRAQFDKALAKA